MKMFLEYSPWPCTRTYVTVTSVQIVVPSADYKQWNVKNVQLGCHVYPELNERVWLAWEEVTRTIYIYREGSSHPRQVPTNVGEMRNWVCDRISELDQFHKKQTDNLTATFRVEMNRAANDGPRQHETVRLAFQAQSRELYRTQRIEATELRRQIDADWIQFRACRKTLLTTPKES